MKRLDTDPAIATMLGLCASCRFVRTQETRRGAVFYRCARADSDDRFVRYPPIPVMACPGHDSSSSPGTDETET